MILSELVCLQGITGDSSTEGSRALSKGWSTVAYGSQIKVAGCKLFHKFVSFMITALFIKPPTVHVVQL